MTALHDVSVAFLFALGGLSVLSALCPPGWQGWDQSCYATCSGRMNWTVASELCEGKRGHLIVPDSQAENDFFLGLVTEYWDRGKRGGFWIGCEHDAATSSTACAATADASRGVGPTYSNWEREYPRQSEPARCVLMYLAGNGTWKNIPCRLEKFVVCERPNTARMYCLTADANGRLGTDPMC